MKIKRNNPTEGVFRRRNAVSNRLNTTNKALLIRN